MILYGLRLFLEQISDEMVCYNENSKKITESEIHYDALDST